MQLARPFQRGELPLDIPRIRLGKAKKLMEKNRLVTYLKDREKLNEERMALNEGVNVRAEGPGSAFFKEKNSF